MTSKFYVYEHWRLDRDECFYVGKGYGRRAYKMTGRNRHHLAIQAKVMREGSAIEVRIVACGLSDDDAKALEIKQIALWRQANIDLANLTDGGEGNNGGKLSAERREKIRQKALGRPWSEAMKKAQEGRRHTIESKAKMSLAKKGRVNGPLSEAHRAKLSQIWQGRAGHPQTLETRAKISAGLMGRPVTKGARESFALYQAMGPKAMARSVICETDGQVFESVTAASRHYKITGSTIVGVCRGYKSRKSAGGKVFTYMDAE